MVPSSVIVHLCRHRCLRPSPADVVVDIARPAMSNSCSSSSASSSSSR